MLVKLLDGSYVEVEKVNSKSVAEVLDIYWSQVKIVKFRYKDEDEKEEKEIDCAIISEKPVIYFTKHQTHRFKNMTNNLPIDCVNEDIINWYIHIHKKNNNNSWSNPHPIVVDYIISNITNLSKGKSLNFYGNPSDTIVDIILERLDDYIHNINIDLINWYEISRNPNPRIISRLIKDFPDKIDNMSFILHDNDEAIDFVLEQLKNRRDFSFLKLYKHPKILTGLIKELDLQYKSMGLSQSFVFPPLLLENPHPIVVEWLFKHIDLIEKDQDQLGFLKNFCQNSNDMAVEWMLSNPSSRIKFPHFFANSNKMAIEYIKLEKQQKLQYDPKIWQFIAKNSNPDMVIYAWHIFESHVDDATIYIPEIEKILGYTNQVNVVYS